MFRYFYVTSSGVIINNKEFILRFYGEGISPNSFTFKELGNLLISIEDSVFAIVEEKYPDADLKEVKISLVDIGNKSEALSISTQDYPPTTNAFKTFGHSIKDETYANLPKTAYSGARHILKIISDKKCSAELNYKEDNIFKIDADIRIIKQENVLAESEGQIYGELVKIGGDNARAWLRLINGNVFSFAITKEQATDLSPKLYNPIALYGKKKINSLSDYIVGFKLYDIVNYQPYNTSSAIKKLQSLTSGIWDEYNDNESITKYIRGDE